MSWQYQLLDLTKYYWYLQLNGHCTKYTELTLVAIKHWTDNTKKLVDWKQQGTQINSDNLKLISTKQILQIASINAGKQVFEIVIVSKAFDWTIFNQF